jgi:hypothetical protein
MDKVYKTYMLLYKGAVVAEGVSDGLNMAQFIEKHKDMLDKIIKDGDISNNQLTLSATTVEYVTLTPYKLEQLHIKLKP